MTMCFVLRMKYWRSMHGTSAHEFWVPSSRCSETRFRTALWKNDFDYVAVSDSFDQRVAARDLEIFLDKLATLTSVDAPYLLDTRYKGLLEGGEIDLAENLRAAADAIRSLPHEHRERWSSLEAVFDELGATPWSPSTEGDQRVSRSRSQRR